MSDNVWPDHTRNFHLVRSSSDKFADASSMEFCKILYDPVSFHNVL